MTRPSTRDLRARSVFAGEASAAAAQLEAALTTPPEVCTPLARRLGLTGALGTVAEQVDGVCTGRLVGDILHGPAKAEAVRALAQREELDLSRCAAYSDSANDLPMLELVGRPCAINPEHKLRRRAEASRWPVRDYRTGRKAARAGLLTAGVTGTVVGAVSAAVAIRRHVS